MGSEALCSAEYALETGDFNQVEVNALRTIYQARTKNQTSMVVCATFTISRLYLYQNKYQEALQLLNELNDEVSSNIESILLNTFDLCLGYIYACTGEYEKIPNWIKKGVLSSLNNVNSYSNETIGQPSSGSVYLGVPEEIIVYTEIKSQNDKIFRQPYVEKSNNGIEQLYYKYITKSEKATISFGSENPVKYKITQNGGELTSSNTGFVTSFSENITLKDGINYFIITYENQRGDTIVEDYIVELDNKSPSLVITYPKEGAVAENGKITVSGVTEPFAVVSINNVNCNSDLDGNFTDEIDFGTSFLTVITHHLIFLLQYYHLMKCCQLHKSQLLQL